MFDRDRLEEIRCLSKTVGSVGVVFSCWDLLHAGHCLVLEFAKRHCDVLVVGLQIDPTIDRSWKNPPVMSLEERRILISSNRHVDAVIEYEDERDHYDILVALNPAVRFLGSDYLALDTFTGKDLDIPVIYHDRDQHAWSSSSLRNRVWEAEEKCRRNG